MWAEGYGEWTIFEWEFKEWYPWMPKWVWTAIENQGDKHKARNMTKHLMRTDPSYKDNPICPVKLKKVRDKVNERLKDYESHMDQAGDWFLIFG